MPKNKIRQSLFGLAIPANYLLSLRFFIVRVREKVEFDSPNLKKLIGCIGLFLGLLLYVFKRTQQSFTVLSIVHSSACSPWVSRIVEQIIKPGTNGGIAQKPSRVFGKMFREYAEHLQPSMNTRKFFENPWRLLGPMVIVLKQAKRDEKGVLLILYSYALPLFLKLFDIGRITEKYFLVLEPSWSGYCTLDILSYSQLNFPVFIQAYEPRDANFIRQLDASLVPIPVSNNWWVDHRIFRPLPSVSKEVDIIMVAGWADFKRHHRFFQNIMKLRSRGVNLKTVLVGYPMEKTRDIIYREAEYYGICDQLEIYESISAEEVNYHFNRAKVNVLWSRREGWNRALVEGLFAGVPCILRDGHNYGYPYPYINPRTGCWSSENDFPEKLLWMVESYQEFSPRDWVGPHMSCQKATEILSESIKTVAFKIGENWTEDLVVKVNGLHGMQYWNSEDKRKFDDDYHFLNSCVRN